MEFIDSHCHLDFLEDPAGAAAAAQVAGVGRIVVPGGVPAQWATLLALRDGSEGRAGIAGVAIAAGLHPMWITAWDVETRDPARLADALYAWQARHGGVAIGECGLDLVIDTPLAEQERLLAAQLALAVELELPLILHCRRAHNPLLRLLKQHRPPRGGVLHAFSGSRELAREYWALGFYLGVGGTITYPRANKTRNTLAEMPLEALLLETDAPDMPLNGRQGQPNLPQFVPEVAAALAALKGVSVADIAAQTTDNSRHLFQLA